MTDRQHNLMDSASRQIKGRVAVVMRTKDRPLLLHRALSSVLTQDYPDWKLYLVNDGGCPITLDNLLLTYIPVFGDRIHVLHHHESKGMEAASNAAIVAGNEEFICIHDDDDSWENGFLSNTIDFLSNPINIDFSAVCTHCLNVHEQIEQGYVTEISRVQWPLNLNTVVIDLADMLSSNRFPPIAMMFRRTAIEAVGLFDDSLPVLGDWDFNIRLMCYGDIGVICKTLANYHHRQSSGNSVYGNSVTAGVSSHEKFNVIMRNKSLRNMLKTNSSLLGAMQAILFADSKHGPHAIHNHFATDRDLHTVDSLLEVCYQLHAKIDQLAKNLNNSYEVDDFSLLKDYYLFDASWYNYKNPDVALVYEQPLSHYLEQRWKELRDPSPFFSTSGYLEANPDVRAAGINPLAHYARYGFKERRRLRA